MATGPRYKVPMKRRIEGKTNYHTRLALLLSEKDRVVVRKSTKNIQVQLIGHNPCGDETYVSSISTDLKNYGYNKSKSNICAAYLTGLLFGYRALKKGYNFGILDIGLHASTKGSKIYALLKGVIDSGLDIPHDPIVFPDNDRINGKFISEYHKSDDISIQFKNTKENIIKEFMNK